MNDSQNLMQRIGLCSSSGEIAPASAVAGQQGSVARRRVREAWALTRDMASSAPGRCALAVLLLLVGGVTEAFGLLMILPLLQVAGLTGQADEPGYLAETVAGIAAGVGVPLGLPGVLGAFLALAAVRAAVTWRRNVLVTRLHVEFINRTRGDIYAALAGASWGHLLGLRRSDIQHVLVSEVNRIGTAAFLLVQLMVGATLATIQFAVALAVSTTIAVGAVFVGIPLVLAARPLVRRSHLLGEQLTGSGRVLRGLVTDFLDGMKLAKSHNVEEAHLWRIKQVAATACERQIAFVELSAATQAGLHMAAAVALAGLVWYAVARAGLALPELTVLAVIFARATPTVLKLLQMWQQLVNALPACASVTALRESLRSAEEPVVSPSHVEAMPVLQKEIEVRDLSFVYPGAAAPALYGINCRIPANGVFVVTGPSGAGKSTLVDLLLGLLTPSRGGILVDGVPLRDVGLGQWRRSVAYVAQEPFLLHDSVRANLSRLCAEATERDMWRALRLASAATFVAALPRGLDTVVGDRGGHLSGGERQRIALAGALLREPRLLVLDEPVSHLDPYNEALVLKALQRLRGRMTIIAIAHGGALLQQADQMLALRTGRVEATGAWPELARFVSADADAP